MSPEQRPRSRGPGGGRGSNGAGLPPGDTPGFAIDPFADAGGHDPLDDWLDALDHLATAPSAPRTPPRTRPAPTETPEARPVAAGAGAATTAPASAPASARAPRREDTPRRAARRAPRVADTPLSDEYRTLVRLVGEDAARRVAALAAGARPHDRFGLTPDTLRQAFPLFHALYRRYFRVRSEGHAHVPAEGPVLLAANHGGLLPFDGAMTIVDLLLHSDPPRLARALVDRWAGALPWVNVFFARTGQVVGTHENIARLLADEEAVLVFPEGIDGIRKPITQRYRLQPFHSGFVRHALRARAPVVPVAILGSDDQAPILFDVKPLARWLGLPAAPITPTFPWLGPLGLLPYPVRYRIVYGEPLLLHERADRGADDDPEQLRALAAEVRRAVQTLIDRHRR